MNIHHTPSLATLADVSRKIECAELSGTRRRDMVSAIRRICEMAGCSPALLSTDVGGLREVLSRIWPARHEVSKQTFAASPISLVLE